MTSIRVSETNRSELLKIQGTLQSERGRSVSMNDTVGLMIEVFKKKYK